MKKIVIPIIVVVILAGVIVGGYFTIDSLFPKANPINVPSASSIVSMTVVKNEMRKDRELCDIAHADVDSVLAKLSKAAPTRKMSVQDSPDAKTYYEIAVETSERRELLHKLNDLMLNGSTAFRFVRWLYSRSFFVSASLSFMTDRKGWDGYSQ